MNLHFNATWVQLLNDLLRFGHASAPRGQETYELPQYTLVVDTRRPVLTVPERQLNHRFMAAEAWWILEGRDDVASIVAYNSRIAQFSDNGETFFGAYGPEIAKQLPYVVQKLVDDPSSRQAGLTIWRQNPPATKDVPCTVALFFQLRPVDGVHELNCHAFMRSSDAWLGIPYDVFNFSMLTHYVAGFLNQRFAGMADSHELPPPPLVTPGRLFLTAASSHLYARDAEAAQAIRKAYVGLGDVVHQDRFALQPATPIGLARSPQGLVDYLAQLKDAKKLSELRWWEA